MVLAALLLAACSGAATGVQPTSGIPGTGGTAQSTLAAGGTSAAGGTTGTETPSVSTTGAATSAATEMATGAATSAGTESATSAATAAPTSGAATSAVGATSAATAESTTSAGGLTLATGTATLTGGTTSGGAMTDTPSANATVGSTATSGGASGVATDTPAAGSTTAATEAATSAATAGATSVVTPLPTSASAGGAATGGQTQGLYVRLSDLFKSTVSTQDSQQVGSVSGVILERPLIAGVDQSTATPNAPTATPVAPMSSQSVFVRYVMVNVASTNGQSSSANSSQGNQVVLPWAAVASSTANSVTLNVSSAAINGAPRVKMLDVVSGSMAWVNPTVAYWNGQGMNIPATGANTTSGTTSGTNLVFIPRERGTINITDAKANVLGSVNDLLINPATGEVIYAVFESGQSFGNRVFVIPMRGLTWAAGEAGATIVNRGNFQFNFNSDLLKNAPAMPDLSQLQLSPALINQLNAFWNSAIQALPTAPVTPAP